MEWTQALIGLAVGLLIGAGVALLVRNVIDRQTHRSAREEAQRIIAEAKETAGRIELEARDEAFRITREAERDIQRRRRQLDAEDERLRKRREELDRRQEQLEQRAQALNKRQSRLDRQRNEIEKMHARRLKELERVAEMTRDEAREHLLKAVEEETRHDLARRIRELEAEAKAEAERRAREVIAIAIQRLASDQVSELSVSVVPLPSDEMKGRIIGRNGRNIRAFEQATGVDVVVDDTPEAVTISSFDPVRREVARRAMTKLVMDGRIHPTRIEKLVGDTRAEVEQIILEQGERAVNEVGVSLHTELIKLLGRLHFRASFGQNQLTHSIETAWLAGMIASEIGADERVAKIGGLLHDIGKAVDHEVEGTHALIGAELARRYGMGPKIVNCIAAHHHEVEQECVEAIIVEAADAISGARPGARRESLDAYIKRIKALEDIASSFKGVDQCYALQAGREVRIIVRPEEIDDLEAIRLAKEIARKIEESLQYPGQIKVTILRETRAIDYAR